MMARSFLRVSLLSVAAVAAQETDTMGALTIGAEVTHSPGNTIFNSIAKMDGYAAIACYDDEGIYCQLLTRSRPDSEYHGDEPFGDTPDDMTELGTPVANFVVTTDPEAGFPSVAAFDQRNALVCYKTIKQATSHYLNCHALKLYGTTISAGPVMTVTTDYTQDLAVDTFDGRGAPVAWAARRAILCYVIHIPTIKQAECRTISLSFPLAADGAKENGNVAGDLTANAPIVVQDSGSTVPPENHPGPRFHPDKALTHFDYFNALLCYTTPEYFYETHIEEDVYYHGQGHCRLLQADIASGTTLQSPDGADTVFSPGQRVTDVATEAFASKSGDPTRALYCFIEVSHALPDQDEDECLVRRGEDYDGKVRITRSGYRCQRWDCKEVRDNTCTHNPEKWLDLRDEADYCRGTPKRSSNDDDNWDRVDPWCYTTDRNTRWETCDVSLPACRYANQATGFNGALRCGIISRTGDSETGFTYKNMERTVDGEASNGTALEVVVAEPSDGLGEIKDTTMTALDEYNMLVCYTRGSNSTDERKPQCPHPPLSYSYDNEPRDEERSCLHGGDGLRVLPADGQPTCRIVSIHGYGSSTYNSKEYNGVADASAPTNIGIVTDIQMGAAFNISEYAGMYPAIVALKPHYAVLCFSKTPLDLSSSPDAPGACHMITADIATKTWQFNAPVDCVNGYGCARLRTAVAERRLGEGVEERRTLTERFRLGDKNDKLAEAERRTLTGRFDLSRDNDYGVASEKIMEESIEAIDGFVLEEASFQPV